MGPVDGGRTGNWPYVVDDFTGAGTGTAMEILYSTEAFSIYQPQFTDDLRSGIWSDLGPQILGDGATQSALGSTLGAPNRGFRVVVF